MGVKGLKTYIKQQRDIRENINILDEIKKWKINKNGEPIIIVDLKGLTYNLHVKDEMSLLLGGRFQPQITVLTQYFEQLKMYGAKIVFFDNGRKYPDDEFIRDIESHSIKLHDRYMHYVALMDAIENKADVMYHLRNTCVQDQAFSLRYNIEKICRALGEFHFTNNCHNLKVAEYLSEQDGNVMAIITDDSDFLAVHGEFDFWGLSETNFASFLSVRYSKLKLNSRLGLSPQRLQSMSVLCGDELLPPGLATSFEKKLMDFKKWYDTIHKDEELMEANDLLKYCKANNSFMYVLLTYKVFKVAEFACIDYRKFKTKTYADLIIPILMKLCGILFKDKSLRPSTRVIFMKFEHKDLPIMKEEEIIYPTMKLPPFLDLVDEKPEFDQERWALLAWVLNFDGHFIMKFRDLRQPNNVKVTIMTLHYLIEQEEILADEAYAILLSEYEKTVLHDSPITICPEVSNVEFVRTANLYNKVYIWMNRCLDVCGLSNVTDLLRFNAPHFHSIMEEFRDDSLQLKIKLKIKPIWTFE